MTRKWRKSSNIKVKDQKQIFLKAILKQNAKKKNFFKSLIHSEIRRDIIRTGYIFLKKRTENKKKISCKLKIFIEIQQQDCKIKLRKNCSENRAKYRWRAVMTGQLKDQYRRYNF